MIVSPAIMATMWKSTFERFSPMDLDEALDLHIDVLLGGLKVRMDEAAD